MTPAGGHRELRAWAAVAAWTVLIYTAIPLARSIQGAVRESVGAAAFGWVVVVAAAAGTLFAARNARAARGAGTGVVQLLWLAASAAVLIGYTVALWDNPEEAIHLLQYGVLGILLHRALRHRIDDWGIYPVAAALGAGIGILDEFVQWVTPGRFWGLRDIWLNFFAGAVVQVGIALGVRPAGIRGHPGPRSIRWLCRATAACVLLLGLSLLNTPPVIQWYAARVPGLAFLATNETVMLEYGTLHRSPSGARFRSRFTREELLALDAARGEEAAAVLDRYRDDAAYSEFLDLYTPITDPFLHEARVHLFRRDRYLQRAERDMAERYRRETLSVVHHENQILEHFFPRTLEYSGYVLPEADARRVAEAFLPEWSYESGVSRKVLTGIGEPTVLATTLLALGGLLAAERRYGREGA